MAYFTYLRRFKVTLMKYFVIAVVVLGILAFGGMFILGCANMPTGC